MRNPCIRQCHGTNTLPLCSVERELLPEETSRPALKHQQAKEEDGVNRDDAEDDIDDVLVLPLIADPQEEQGDGISDQERREIVENLAEEEVEHGFVNVV